MAAAHGALAELVQPRTGLITCQAREPFMADTNLSLRFTEKATAFTGGSLIACRTFVATGAIPVAFLCTFGARAYSGHDSA